MRINVPLPTEGTFTDPVSFQQVLETITAKRPVIGTVARRAFRENHRTSWEATQQLLYHWNMEEFLRTSPATNPGRMVRQTLRNTILAEQEAAHRDDATLQLQCRNAFTPEKAIAELRQRATEHRINHHPLLAEMETNGLPARAVRLFLENYYINNRVFHLHIASQSMSVPFEVRPELARNFYDELGQGQYEKAHPVLFLANFNSVGRPDEIHPLVEALNLMNVKIHASMLSGDHFVGLGCFGFIEVTMPAQMRAILSGLRQSGLPEPDLEFWRLHIQIDEVHGDAWFQEVGSQLTGVAQAESVLRGGLLGLEARAGVYDGIWNAMQAL